MTRNTKKSAQYDRHVGAQIRERRIMLGLTQQQLADMIGVTYQQAHKYERGVNRVSAGRLWEIARVLSVPVGYFYDGIDGGSGGGGGDVTPVRERMMLEIARNFIAIKNPKHQEQVCALIRALAEPEPKERSSAAHAATV